MFGQWLVEFLTSPDFWAPVLAGFSWLVTVSTARGLDKRVEGYKLDVQRDTERLKTDWQRESQLEIERMKADLLAKGQHQLEQVRAEIQRDTERLKTDWQRESQLEIERMKADLLAKGQHQLEQLRAELTARNDTVRHAMERQILRAQLTTKKMHDVYAELIAQIRYAEGAIGNLMGGHNGPNYSTFDDEQLLKVLKDIRLGGEDEASIRAVLNSDKGDGIKLIEDAERRRRTEDARRKVGEATNYLILNGIFTTKAVRESAHEVLKLLLDAWVPASMAVVSPGSETADSYRAHHGSMRAAASQIGALEEAMQADIFPEIVWSQSRNT